MPKDKKHSKEKQPYSKPEQPKEFSTALKGLRFMARKEETQPSQVKTEQNLNKIQWTLPDKLEKSTMSVFAPYIRHDENVVFRKALSFSSESDSIAELRIREKRSSSKKSKNVMAAEFGRFKGRGNNANDEEDDDGSVSSLDDVAVAEHFLKNKHKRRRT
jgi:hypothetical protein